ncbi:MAG TPA: ChbG/HpnK family deacetylase [Gemmataceae bacterium]|nr:ChbG/HpnK family deacetylase [Gemmataceae bacterium]
MARRHLLVIADDIGIGPNTTAGILHLADQGIVTGSAFLVNSPYAIDAIRKWRQSGSRLDIGWHPNLTLDTPLSPSAQVASLIGPDGTFWPLGAFLKRWFLGLLDPCQIERELRLQLERFVMLVGHPPTFVNCHQHVGLFAPVGEILLRILAELPTRPYVRRVQEPWPVLSALPGARGKRAFLGWLGCRLSRIQDANGFPGNDWMAGIASPQCITNPEFFVRWLHAMPGNVVELMCHPGRLDPTLIGRDCTDSDGLLQQRVNELRWLGDPSFLDAVEDAGFQLTSPAELLGFRASVAKCA